MGRSSRALATRTSSPTSVSNSVTHGECVPASIAIRAGARASKRCVKLRGVLWRRLFSRISPSAFRKQNWLQRSPRSMPIVSGGTVAFGPAAALVETGIMLFIGGLLTIRVWQSRRCVVSENQASHPIYLKVSGRWVYLYRAIDRQGQLIDSMLSAKRDMAAAQRFFRSAQTVAGCRPAQVTTDGHKSYPRAIAEVLGKKVKHRNSRYKNNRIEMV